MPEQKHSSFNVIAQCRSLRVNVWACPPFLFLVMGIVTVGSMLATYTIAQKFADEETVIILVSIVTAALLILGNFIIEGFNRIAQANQMKTEFLSIITHQLRSPLSVFKWTIEVLARTQERGNPDSAAVSSLRALRDNTEEMIKLVNTLLEVSRIEARRFVLKEEEFSLYALTKRLIGELESFAGASGILFSLKAPDQLPRLVADQERIGIVVTNLITNAVQYTHGPATIDIAIAREGGALVWSVTDKGMGIPRDQQKSIFQKFFRGENAKAKQTHGSGIGLYVSKAIVEASGGRIGFRSVEGQGTTFWFTLPMRN